LNARQGKGFRPPDLLRVTALGIAVSPNMLIAERDDHVIRII
jgi:hypothetical protein